MMNPKIRRRRPYPNNVELSAPILPRTSPWGPVFATAKDWPRIFGPAVTPVLMAVAALPDQKASKLFSMLGAKNRCASAYTLRVAIRRGLVTGERRRFRINPALVEHDDLVAFLRALASANGMIPKPQPPKVSVEKPVPMPHVLFDGKLRGSRRRKALCAIALLGESYHQELAEILGIDMSLTETLRALAGEGVLARRSIGTAVAYSLNPELPGVEWLRSLLIKMAAADPQLRWAPRLARMRRCDIVENGMWDVSPMIMRLPELAPDGKTEP